MVILEDTYFQQVFLAFLEKYLAQISSQNNMKKRISYEFL